MKATIGRIILYVLSQQDCEAIQARRDLARIKTDQESWGNPVSAGDIVPAQIVRVWNEDTGLINGQATLDGFDSYWLLSRHNDQAKTPGTWHWMEHQLKTA